MAIRLPILKQLVVNGYLLYPGTSERPGLQHEFSPGVTLIVGTNGLGKTTLINMVFRCIVGPFNPPKDAGVVSSARQVESVWPHRKAFFARRVGDQASEASARLIFSIGETTFDVTRSLQDTRLLKLFINDAPVKLSRLASSPDHDEGEKLFRKAFFQAVGASSFVAALQIIRQLVFYDETRRALLWDAQSQMAVLRDLLIGAKAAGKLREIEGKYLSADSRERNLRWQVNRLSNDIGKMKAAQATSVPLSQRLSVLMQRLRADEDRREVLEQDLDDAEQEVRRLRLETARTGLAHEDARASLEEVRLEMARSVFPDLGSTGHYILSRFYTGSACRACGADVSDRLARLDALLQQHHCLVCESPADRQTLTKERWTDVPETLLSDRYAELKSRLELAEKQHAALQERLDRAEQALKLHSEELAVLISGISDTRKEAKTLQSRLPPDEETTRKREAERQTMAASLNAIAQERRITGEELKSLLVEVREAAGAVQGSISNGFSYYASEFLAEEATLTFAPRQERIGQSGEKFDLPRFRLDMTSAAYAGKAPRDTADDVSESQREFIDLAYRMALIDACVDGPACLIMETPEASLDGVFMEQAGKMLNSYGGRADRQLLVTSNLSNTGMVRSLMENQPEIEARVINLFRVAAPTKAVTRFEKDYERLLTESLGPGSW